MNVRKVFLTGATLIIASTQTALALDDCMIGRWSADLNDMTQMMAQDGMPIDSGEGNRVRPGHGHQWRR